MVQEILVDGSTAAISDASNVGVLNSAASKNQQLLCILVKRNWDTLMALKSIARQLDIDADRIQIAGLKDAKAVTAQYITIEGIDAVELRKVSIKDLKIHSIGYVNKKLSSYYLMGNCFHVAINSLDFSKVVVEKRLAKSIRELEVIGGAPNFFGHQRFGTTRPVTHLVGKAIIEGDFRKAAMLFLSKSFKTEHVEFRNARDKLGTNRNFEEASKKFPRQLRYEHMMLRHLSASDNDFVGAFRSLPLKLRQLFVQAYQSYLFNKFLSARIENGIGLQQVETGDFVIGVERSGLPAPFVNTIVKTSTRAEMSKAVKAGVKRVALPLIGFKQRLSEGFSGELEKKILEEEDITFNQFRVPRMLEVCAKGGLRSIITPVKDFSLGPIEKDLSSKLRVDATFMLYRSSYATIVLRELMKPRNPIAAGF